MKTFKRASLPETIKYNGKIYGHCIRRQDDAIRVEVLSARLRGATDLHGHPYMPTVHYFKPIGEAPMKQGKRTAKRLAKDYEFETEEEYFDYIVLSLINGQRQQVRDLFGQMRAVDKERFLNNWLNPYHEGHKEVKQICIESMFK